MGNLASMSAQPGYDLRDILLSHLRDVTGEVTSAFPLTGLDVDQVGILEHHFEATVHASEDDVEGVGWLHEPGVILEEPRAHGDDFTAVIATATAVTIDLERSMHLRDVLDCHSAWAAEFLPLALRSGELNEAVLAPNRNADGSRLLIVAAESISLDPAWRHLGGVGRLLLGHAVRWFAVDCVVIAIRPAADPDDWQGRLPDIGTVDGTARHLAGTLGFARVRDTGIYVLDPTTGELDYHIEDLEGRLLGRNAGV